MCNGVDEVSPNLIHNKLASRIKMTPTSAYEGPNPTRTRKLEHVSMSLLLCTNDSVSKKMEKKKSKMIIFAHSSTKRLLRPRIIKRMGQEGCG